jgi:cysteine desulfurase
VIYLDYNASAPLRREAREAMLPYLSEEFGNPSSVHRLGSRARVAVEEARAEVAAAIGARANEVCFTSGGTESNNLALLGVAVAREGALVTSTIEHSSVLAPLVHLERSGREVRSVRVDAFGRVDLDHLREVLALRPALVSIGWANNEIGAVQPIDELARLCGSAGVPLHVDAVQALGKIPVDVSGVALMSLSAHKIGGPKGVGALYVRSGTTVVPLHRGGGQERGLRAGTENVAGIVGFAAACRMVSQRVADGAGIGELRERLWRGLSKGIEGVERNSPVRDCLPNTLNVVVAGTSGEAVVAALDLAGVAVSTGSACAAGAAEPSHVLQAIGLSERAARDSVRLSLGPETTGEEIDETVEILLRAVGRIRGVQRPEVAHV